MAKKEKKKQGKNQGKEQEQGKTQYAQITNTVSSVLADAVPSGVMETLITHVIDMAVAQKDEYEKFSSYTEFSAFLLANPQYQKCMLNMKTRKVHTIRETVYCPLSNNFYVSTKDGICMLPNELFADWCFVDGTPYGKRKAEGFFHTSVAY